MPSFVVWSTGAVRAELIDRVEVRPSGDADVWLTSGRNELVPARDVVDLFRQLKSGWTKLADEAKAADSRHTLSRQIPAMYTGAKLRCIIGPAADGSVGLGIDFPGVGATIRVRLSGAHAAWLASGVTQPHCSHSPSSSGIPSFELSIGGDVECTAPTAKSSDACQASS